ncbi:MAG: hypothetical protein ACRC17_05210 [Culicoidibacterales bacterium]
MNNRKLLVTGIGILSICLVVSVSMLVTVLPKLQEIEHSAVIEPLTPETEVDGVTTEHVSQDEEVNATTADALDEVQLEPVEAVGATEVSLGMAVSDLVRLEGEPLAIREVTAAFIYEYADLTYVVDQQQTTLIGYWVYSGQQPPLTALTIDWSSGFAQTQPDISWSGPYYNDGRGSAYVLHGYANFNGEIYTLEFGADDEQGFGNQLIAIYRQ